MASNDVQEHRRRRLEAAVDKAGGKAPLGRLLGFLDGSMVGQMLRGERPISEKTVERLESRPGWAGWFAESAPAEVVPEIAPAVAQLLLDLEYLPKARQSAILDMIHQEAEAYREVVERATRRRRAPTMAAATSSGSVGGAIKIKHGDGNPLQGALPLSTVNDPFNAEPPENEREWYGRIPKLTSTTGNGRP